MVPSVKKNKIKPDNFHLVHLLGTDEEKITVYQDWRCPLNLLEEAFNEWRNLNDSRATKIKEAIAVNPNCSTKLIFDLSQDKNVNVKNLALANIRHPTFHKKILENFHSQCLLPLFDLLKKDPSLEATIREGCFLTGGAICSLIRRNTSHLTYNNQDDIKDFDFYFSNKNSLEKIIQHFLQNFIPVGPDHEHYRPVGSLTLIANTLGYEISELKTGGFYFGSYKLYPQLSIIITNNAITLKSSTRGSPDFQFIFKVFNPSPQTTTKLFDFVHCQGILTLQDGQLDVSSETYASIISKKIIFKGGINPVSALIRMNKLLKKGWYVNRVQLIKILAYASSKIDFSNPTVLKEQLRGFYFESRHPEISDLPDDKELTLEELFEWLDELTY